MGDTNIKFSIPLDDDGFLSLQCPFCSEYFKIPGTETIDDSHYELFCPYCGLVTETNHFLSKEVREKALRLAKNHMYELLNDFMSNMEKTFKNSKSVKVKKGKRLDLNSPKIIIETDNMNTFILPCCERKIKANLIDSIVYCPFCGGETHGDIVR